MENPESKFEKNRLEQLREAISVSPESIEAEFARTDNDWLNCLGTRIFIIETYLNSPKIKDFLTEEEIVAGTSKLESLKEKLESLKSKYPDKKTIPPEEVKRELLAELNILG